MSDLAAAAIPLKRVDSHSVAMTVRCLVAIEEAELLVNPEERLRMVATFSRHLRSWLDAVCAGPLSRAKLGIKPAEKKGGKLAELLAARQAKRG